MAAGARQRTPASARHHRAAQPCCTTVLHPVTGRIPDVPSCPRDHHWNGQSRCQRTPTWAGLMGDVVLDDSAPGHDASWCVVVARLLCGCMCTALTTTHPQSPVQDAGADLAEVRLSQTKGAAVRALVATATAAAAAAAANAANAELCVRGLGDAATAGGGDAVGSPEPAVGYNRKQAKSNAFFGPRKTPISGKLVSDPPPPLLLTLNKGITPLCRKRGVGGSKIRPSPSTAIPHDRVLDDIYPEKKKRKKRKKKHSCGSLTALATLNSTKGITPSHLETA